MMINYNYIKLKVLWHGHVILKTHLPDFFINHVDRYFDEDPIETENWLTSFDNANNGESRMFYLNELLLSLNNRAKKQTYSVELDKIDDNDNRVYNFYLYQSPIKKDDW